MSSFTQSEILAAVAKTVIVANVLDVDTAAAMVRVSFGPDASSTWLPWLAQRASAISVWAPPEVGEQVVVLCPAGDTRFGVVMGAIYSGKNSAPSSSPGEHLLSVGQAQISVTTDRIVLSCGGSSLTIGAGGISLSGPVTEIDTGAVNHKGTDIGDTHTHSDVAAGTSRTGDPK